MKKNWEDIKWIFEVDGSLRDIYVQDVSIEDWEKLIDFLNENYPLKYHPGEENQIENDYIIRKLTDESGEMELKSVSIDLGEIDANCYFFLSDQIEFDIDPKEIKSINDFEKIERFMKSISKILKNQVTLTGENNIKFPLIKIDVTKDLIKVLTEKEAIEYHNQETKLTSKIQVFRTKFMLKFFPEEFNEKLLKSANEPYKSTKRSKNVW